MRRCRAIVVLLSFVFPPAAAFMASAQQTAVDVRAVEALSACANRHGLPTAATLGISADAQMISFDGSEYSVKWKILGKKLRVETSGAKRRSLIVAGVAAPFRQLGTRRDKLRFSDAAHFFPEFLPMLRCTTDPAKPGSNVRYEGQELVNGRAAHHVHIWVENGSRHSKADTLLTDQHLFPDAENGEVLQIRNFSFSPEALENHSIWEIRYSDYRVVDGVRVPFKLDRYLGGQWHSTIRLTTVSFHANLSAADFE